MNEQKVEKRLEEIYDEAYTLYESFDKREDPGNSPEFQVSSFSRKFNVIV